MKTDILIHLHIFYIDMFNELANIIDDIKLNKKIIITYVDKNIDEKIFLSRFPDADIRLVKNIGFDIKPFLDVIKSVNLDDYKYILKLHTKRDYTGNLLDFCLPNGVCCGGTKWRDYLLRPFVNKNFSNTLHALEKPNVGMVGDNNVLLSEHQDIDSGLLNKVKSYTKLLGLKYKPYSFFGGTMFIAKSNLFKVFCDAPEVFQWQKSDDNRDYRGDVYAFERLLGEVIIAQNKKLYGVNKKQKKDAKHKKLKLFEIQREYNKTRPNEKSWRFRLLGCRLFKIVEYNGYKHFYIFNRYKHQNNYEFIAHDYGEWIHDLHTDKSLFVPITDKPFKRRKDTPKIFAYYLTQFHAIPENDNAHGKGFTEWTNVASASPQFVGHYQPKIPYDVGFYNLLDVNVMRRQAELAKMYGIYGWCFYYYWFSGKKVLEKPLENFLNSDIDLHFHLCWANENWSKLWDGGNKEIILEQKLQSDDADKFFKDILPFFQDKRYEKIDNKPLLMVYRPSMFDVNIFKNFVARLDYLAKQSGFNGIFFMCSNFQDTNPDEYDMQGVIEFPPHGIGQYCYEKTCRRIDNNAKFHVLSMTEFINKKLYINTRNYLQFKACFPSWDNTPRKAYSDGYVMDITNAEFAEWLSGIIKWTKNNNPKNMQYVYINAWNEWGEGAILEPTTRWGYSKLQTVKNCLEKTEK